MEGAKTGLLEDFKIRVGKRRSVIPDGQYKARVLKISRECLIAKRPTFVFEFQIVEGPFSGQRLNGFVNANYETFSSDTKLFKWHAAITGEELDEGSVISTQDFMDKVLLIDVETKRSRRTKNEFSNVKEVIGTVFEL